MNPAGVGQLSEIVSGTLQWASVLDTLWTCGGVYFVPLKGIPTGLESTERFGRGLDPDLARKAGFLNFFGHFGSLARALECRVDSVHTNFSRRSHPCHPDFLPRGRMSRSSPFGFDLGSTLGQLWADFGPTWGNFGSTLGRLWPDFGTTLGRLWPDFGPTLDRLWTDFGPTLGQLWADFGPTLGRLWTDFGPTLGQLWTDFGPTLGQLGADLGPTWRRLWTDLGTTSGGLWATNGD